MTINLKNRLATAVISYLKGVRNELQFFEVLTKAVDGGGMGLIPDKANQTIKQINTFRDSILSQGKNMGEVVAEYSKAAGIGSIEPTYAEASAGRHEALSMKHGELKELKIDNDKPIAKVIHNQVNAMAKPFTDHLNLPLEKHIDFHQRELAAKKEIGETKQVAINNKPQTINIIAQRAVPNEIKKMVDAEILGHSSQLTVHSAQNKPKQAEVPRPKMTIPPNSSRPRLDDVKYTPKVYGPVDELMNLSIIDFRRMGKSPDEAIVRIMDKLNLLGQESLALKSEGAEALKKSELYRAYSGIMSLSITQGKPLIEAVNSQDKLTLTEVEAITKLNKQLSA